jgi:hypothetical protein
MTHPRLPENNSLVRARREACEVCPYWDARVDVCGFVGETYYDAHDIRHTVGCWCNLKIKRRILHATCWANAHAIQGSGWPDK